MKALSVVRAASVYLVLVAVTPLAAPAPRGQEASYGALSYVPFLLAKIFVLSSAGSLLERYCPEHGERHSDILWLLIGLAATLAPIGLVLLRRFIRVHEAGRQD